MYFVEAAILGWPEVSGIRAPKAAPATTVVIDTMTRPTSARRKWACLHRTYHERCQPEDVSPGKQSGLLDVTRKTAAGRVSIDPCPNGKSRPLLFLVIGARMA